MTPEEARKRWGKIFSAYDCTGCPLDNLSCWSIEGEGCADTVANYMTKQEENKNMFTKRDLKPGMVCVLRNGTYCIAIPKKGGITLCRMYHSKNCGSYLWNAICESDIDSRLDPDSNDESDIMAVYGLADSDGLIFGDGDELFGRDLIWKREPKAKEVTMADVEKAFGCRVKIVKGESENG